MANERHRRSPGDRNMRGSACARLTFVRLVEAVLVLILGVPTVVLAGPAFNRPPRLVDSQGRVLGTVLDSRGGATMTVMRRERVGDERLVVTLEVPFGGGWDGSLGAVYYETADCSGPAYLDMWGGNSPSVRHAWPDTSEYPVQRAYYAGDPIEQKTILGSRGSPTDAGCAPQSGSWLVAPARVLDLTQFQPPFRVE